MDQTKLRKSHGDSRRSETLPSNHKPCNKKKSRHKSNAYQLNCPQPYDLGFAPYPFNLAPQARIHPSSQRLFSHSDQSVCHYPVPFSFSLEHVSLPFYSALLQPGAPSTAPLERAVRINRANKQKIPGMFQTFKQNNEVDQDYMSLPPVNCDLNSKKSNDEDSTCKRRFSDPGVAQISSDEESRGSESSNNSSLADIHLPYTYGLIEQVNELRESNSQLTRELHEIKLEMESLKILSASWKPYSDNIQPGQLSDAIVELREAIKVNEEAFAAKMMVQFEKNSARCNEAHRRLEEMIEERVNQRLGKLEEQIRKLSDAVNNAQHQEKVAYESPSPNENILTIQQQLMDSEKEKLSLRKELQEAIESRKKAEANTHKLERLLGALSKKMNGISQEFCLDEKPNPIRPLAASFDQNPFIIANNRQTQKVTQHKRNAPRKENSQGSESECGSGSDGSNGLSSGSIEGALTTPQVTITGPRRLNRNAKALERHKNRAQVMLAMFLARAKLSLRGVPIKESHNNILHLYPGAYKP